MSAVVVSAKDAPRTAAQCFIVCKGAPEALGPLLCTKPKGYDDLYRTLASRGLRVLASSPRALVKKRHQFFQRYISEGRAAHLHLAIFFLKTQALASRPLREEDGAALPNGALAFSRVSRKKAERELNFVGFVALQSPLKLGTSRVIRELTESRHVCVMITGDGVLTAAHVARRVRIATRQAAQQLALCVVDDEDAAEESSSKVRRLAWFPLEAADDAAALSASVAFDPAAILQLAHDFDLCVRGDALEVVHASHAQQALRDLCLASRVFARVKPDQKELIVSTLNDCGKVTLMCGDGTNDVGALKRAHVGVSIMNSPVLEARLQRDSKRYAKSALAELEQDAMDLDPSLVNLGDASIASPFASKRATIDCVLSIICQGRCTLVTMIQIFKILAQMCLVSAYMLSSLYLRGVKQGDTQMTVLFKGVLFLAQLWFFFKGEQGLRARALSLSLSLKEARVEFCFGGATLWRSRPRVREAKRGGASYEPPPFRKRPRSSLGTRARAGRGSGHGRALLPDEPRHAAAAPLGETAATARLRRRRPARWGRS